MRRFLSADETVAVSIGDEAWTSIVERCTSAGRRETGGVLIGRYTEWRDRAIVIEATGPPRDSRFGPFAFWRGLRGLRRLLKVRWTESRTYYLGEWHFHPFMSPDPSAIDLNQMRVFAADPDYRCPKPVLLVIGGDPTIDPKVTVSVVDAGDSVLRLAPTGDSEVPSEVLGVPPSAVS
jgi:hypothetical protein